MRISAAGSRHASIFLTRFKGAALQYRSATDGLSASTANVAALAPYWLRLTRQGSVVTGYIYANGTAWSQVGTIALNSFASSVYLGLAVTSHNNTLLATAVIDSMAKSPKDLASVFSVHDYSVKWLINSSIFCDARHEKKS